MLNKRNDLEYKHESGDSNDKSCVLIFGLKLQDFLSHFDVFMVNVSVEYVISINITFENSKDDGEAEMRRLKMELQRTMDLYSTACKEALTAKQKVKKIHIDIFSYF